MRAMIALCLILAASAYASEQAAGASDAAGDEAVPLVMKDDPRFDGAVATFLPINGLIANREVAGRVALIYSAHHFPDLPRNERPPRHRT
ncbi:MAG: hypothetical protein EOP61_05080 [Sphingomonadales bacterium]|nr:MAG: hypothetical protein EOP61_05080 [Sphingomonadales bacterium]